jgi:long-chain acyl-CoA synthetase
MREKRPSPWQYLDEYRGTMVKGEWPTMPELFAITVKRFPGNACFTSYDPNRKSLTYAEAAARIDAVARKLRGIGIGRGSKVAVTGKNSPEWAVAYLAVLSAGAVVVPIDYQITVAEIVNLVRAGDVEALFCDEEKYTEITGACPGLKAAYSLAAGGPGYLYTLDDPKAPPAQPAADTDLAAIMFTSGTTGQPKGVMLTHRNLTSDCLQAQGNLAVHPTDVFYALLPIHHSYTMLAVFIEAISTGAEVVFGKRMVTKQIFKDLKEARVTMFLGVPMIFNKVLGGIMKAVREKGTVVYGLVRFLMAVSGLVKKLTRRNPGKAMFHSLLEQASLASIRICISGGGPLAPDVFRKYNQLGIDFVQGYGLTETSPIITLNPTEAYRETSVGRIVPGVEMRILQPDPAGVGEIAVRGSMVMAGYYKMPEETAKVLSADGWLKTGDLGYMDRDNYVYLTGRAKNLIVTEGGKNVYPEEIENQFQLFDDIEQVLVLGYVEDAATRSEGIQAMLYPNLERFKSEDSSKSIDWSFITDKLKHIVDEVNQKLLPYQRISKVTVLKERLEETTTKKVKRFTVKK